MAETITVGGKGVSATLVLRDSSGNQTMPKPGAPPVWSSSDPAIASVHPSADGLSAQILPAGAIGTVTITALVDDAVHIANAIEATAGAVAGGTMIFNSN